jgi:tetraacyldisaccharide 4'-kinase
MARTRRCTGTSSVTSDPLARRLERLWYGHSPLAGLLQPAAWLFGLGVSLRRQLYRAGWLVCEHIPVPVIAVGNLTVGGAGKTPVVDWLVSRLHAEGFRPGIVSRGFGGRSHDAPVRVAADSLAEDVGDEPLLLARRTGAPVAVCVHRARAARMLVDAGVEVIVTDDGLQHYALHRDLEIIVLDGERQLGNGRLLPAGPLREPAARLREAAIVLANGGPPDLPWPRFELRVSVAIPLAGGQPKPLAAFASRPVWAVGGIGNPGRFHAQLRRCGIDVRAVEIPDHGRIDIARLRQDQPRPVLMTEKDAVKYPRCSEPDVWYVPAEVAMPPQAEQMILSRVLGLFPQRGVNHGRH